MKKKKITKSFSNLADHREAFRTFGDVKPSDVKPTNGTVIIDVNDLDEHLIDAEKFIKQCVLPTKALCDMDGFKLNIKSYCENVLPKYDTSGNTEILNEVLMLCKKYGLF